MEPVLRTRREGQRDLPVAVWRFTEPRLVVASAPHGGGIGPRRWIVNATVPASYGRRDPDRHLGKLGVSLGLPGRGAGMMTAVDVRRLEAVSEDGVEVVASVGLGKPLWAAADESARAAEARQVGTVNVVAFLPERMTEAALVNAVATVAEAKAQAMFELGLPGTGTATDATCLVCPTDARLHRFGGPRSLWGARLARAVHAAVLRGGGAPDRQRDGAVMGTTTLVLGGTRSGKSTVAEHLASRLGGGALTYVATAVVGEDESLASRVAAHRARRPASWATVEAGGDLPGLLRSIHGMALVDALGPWVAWLGDAPVPVDDLCAALAERPGDTVVVSEEVGLSVHPPTATGRAFVDALGTLNQAVASIAGDVLLVVAGRVLPLLTPDAHVPPVDR